MQARGGHPEEPLFCVQSAIAAIYASLHAYDMTKRLPEPTVRSARQACACLARRLPACVCLAMHAPAGQR